jgi:hypothetical protein
MHKTPKCDKCRKLMQFTHHEEKQGFFIDHYFCYDCNRAASTFERINQKTHED